MPDYPSVKILILGASDSEGTVLTNFADSWREQLRTRLPSLIGEEVEIDHRRFYVHVGDPDAFLKRAVADSKPDFVLIAVTGYAFSTASVGNRLRRVLGRRLGNWAEERGATFDNLTDGQPGSPLTRFNSAAHWLVGKAIGRDALSKYDEVFGGYRRAVEHLARIENLDAVILGTTDNGPHVQRRLPYVAEMIDRFNSQLQGVVEAHRFGWLDRQSIITSLPPSIARPDGLHAGPEIHAVYAEALLSIIPARHGHAVR